MEQGFLASPRDTHTIARPRWSQVVIGDAFAAIVEVFSLHQFETITVTAPGVALFPAASRATAVSVGVPLVPGWWRSRSRTAPRHCLRRHRPRRCRYTPWRQRGLCL